MGANFSRIKNWTSLENLTNEDLNAEIDNILDNLDAAGVDDYSTNVTQMQTTTDPGEVSSEALATSMAGELERLRFVLKEIKGDVAQWYSTGATSLSEIFAALGSSLDGNRISSGLVRSASSQPVYLVPNGSAATAKVDGDTTNLIYYVDGTQITVNTEVAVSSLSTAPASNNTALVNDVAADDSEATKLFGEYGSSLTIDAAGTEITSLIGETAAFKINNGVSDEYFLAYVKSATEFTEVRRGFFFDSNSAPVPRLAIADNDTITLLRITWLFGKNDGTMFKVTSEPSWQATEPGSPVSGDYWFDLTNGTWKSHNGSDFVSADATLLGLLVCDSSNCIGGRSLEFAGAAVENMGIILEKSSATIIRGLRNFSKAGIYNQAIKYMYDGPTWDITTDLESGVSEASDTMFYLYLTEDGDTIISDKIPFDRVSDLGGYYHPHHVWRCIGQVYNDGSSDFGNPKVFDGLTVIFPAEDSSIVSLTDEDSPYTVPEAVDTILVDAISDDVTINLPRAGGQKGRRLEVKRTDLAYAIPQDFVDGDVTVGTDNINTTAHGYADLMRVQLTTTTTLPAGLATGTNYYVILIDANNYKLANSRANAILDTAVDITAAASGGTHTATVKKNDVIVDGDGSETIDDETTYVLHLKNDMVGIVADGLGWEIVAEKIAIPKMQAYKNGGSVSSTLPFTNWTGVELDTHSFFNDTTGLVYAPRDGDYYVSSYYQQTAGNTSTANIYKNGVRYKQGDDTTSSASKSVSCTMVALVAGDTFHVTTVANSTLISQDYGSHITVYFLKD